VGHALPGSTNSSAAAQTGDTIVVCAGDTQSAVGRNARLSPAFNPANAGVTISCATRGSCTLTLSSQAGPVAGCAVKNNTVWDGFVINGSDAPTYSDTGLVDVYNASGCVIRYMTLTGDPDYADPNPNGCSGECGNHGLIRLEEAVSPWVHHNTLNANPINGIKTANGASIEGYDSRDVLIEYNTINDAGAGVFAKGDQDADSQPQQNWIVRFNLIRNVGNVAETTNNPCLYIQADRSGQWYQNICHASSAALTNIGVLIFGFAANGENPNVPVDIGVTNNVLDGFGYGLALESQGSSCNTASIQYENIRFFNNIILNGLHAIGSQNCTGLGSPAEVESEHTIAFGFSSNFVNLGGTTRTLATWKSTELQDTATGNGAAGTSVDPQMTSSTDYHPLAAYVATQGVDILDLDGDASTTDAIPAGAYVTGSETIGVGGATVAPPPMRIRIRMEDAAAAILLPVFMWTKRRKGRMA
jgi:hypothetical protein